jgi:hypothetical protein
MEAKRSRMSLPLFLQRHALVTLAVILSLLLQWIIFNAHKVRGVVLGRNWARPSATSSSCAIRGSAPDGALPSMQRGSL